jgi:hypothetical protein
MDQKYVGQKYLTYINLSKAISSIHKNKPCFLGISFKLKNLLPRKELRLRISKNRMGAKTLNKSSNMLLPHQNKDGSPWDRKRSPNLRILDQQHTRGELCTQRNRVISLIAYLKSDRHRFNKELRSSTTERVYSIKNSENFKKCPQY